MAEESDSDLAVGLTLLFGGVGLFVGGYAVKDQRVALALKAGGIIAAIGGAVLGGEALISKLGLGSLFGADRKPVKKSTDVLSESEKNIANGTFSGRILAPTDGAHLDPGALGTTYKVSARLINDTNESRRVRARFAGTESYLLSGDEDIGGDAGEWTVGAQKSVLIEATIGFGTYAHLPFASPDVELTLWIDDFPAHTVRFTYD